jgi:hypothetical protein
VEGPSGSLGLTSARWILGLAFGVVSLLDVQATRAQMFSDKLTALQAIKNVSPKGSTCVTGGHFRVGYGEEIAYCHYGGKEYRGNEVLFRLAATEGALLMDFQYDVSNFNSNFPNPEMDSVIQGYLEGASELFQQFSFTFADLRSCSSKQQLADKEQSEWHPDPVPEPKPKPTRIRHPPLVMRCRSLPTGFYLTVRPIAGEFPDDP